MADTAVLQRVPAGPVNADHLDLLRAGDSRTAMSEQRRGL
jgi:hypothetical protein